MSKRILTEIAEKESDFVYFRDKVRIHFQAPGINQSLTVDLIMKKDSIIWGSASVFLGMEIFRFFITPEGLTVIDKINRTYYTFGEEYLRTKIPFPGTDLSMIQKLLLGRLILLGQVTYGLEEDSNKVVFTGLINGFKHQFKVQQNILQISEHQLFNTFNELIGKVVYTGTLEKNKYKIPKKVEFWVYLPEYYYARISYFEPKFEKHIKFDTGVPNGYSKAN